jgi:hypothetical protein
MSDHVAFVVLMAVSIASVHFAGRLAERRGRRFRRWAGIGALIGPLALPLVFLLPNLQRRDSGRR